ncbi:hypothetical protein BH11PLA2_BH11PLA2_35870 [soil metagenome]
MNAMMRLLLFLFLANQVNAAEFFVAPTGSDSNPGELDKPFATLAKAQDAVSPGDTVWIRGGTYTLNDEQIAKKQRIYAYVIHLTKSGTATKPIRYWAYKDEKPVFDFSHVKPPRYRVHAFQVHGSWLHLRGLNVTGVQVTITTHTQSICFANEGSHNIYERLSMYDSQAIGYYCVNGSDNLVLNCDAYNNHDSTSESGRGGNVDGFGFHPTKGSTGNIVRGCRAWFNSDDGYDCISAHRPSPSTTAGPSTTVPTPRRTALAIATASRSAALRPPRSAACRIPCRATSFNTASPLTTVPTASTPTITPPAATGSTTPPTATVPTSTCSAAFRKRSPTSTASTTG